LQLFVRQRLLIKRAVVFDLFRARRKIPMKILFQDATFSFEFLRVLSEAIYGGSDIGECLLTGSRITEGDVESWHQEWNKTDAEDEHCHEGATFLLNQRVFDWLDETLR
jgi:hypothetical protein